MAYSRSRKTLEKMIPSLGPVLDGRETSWQIPPGADYNAHQWAYKVREALFIAQLFERDYPLLAEAGRRLTVQVAAENLVQAVTARGTPEATALLREGVNTGMQTSGPIAPTSGPQSAYTIIEAWQRQQPSNARMYFPEAALDEDDLLRLWRWCRANRLCFMEHAGSITLMRATSDLADVAWSPIDIGLQLDSEGNLLAPEAEDAQ